MPYINPTAARRLRTMREERGLSPEALAYVIAQLAEVKGWGNRGTVDPHTIRRVEKTGHIPGVRVQFVLAFWAQTVPHEFWRESDRIWADQERALDREAVIA